MCVLFKLNSWPTEANQPPLKDGAFIDRTEDSMTHATREETWRTSLLGRTLPTKGYNSVGHNPGRVQYKYGYKSEVSIFGDCNVSPSLWPACMGASALSGLWSLRTGNTDLNTSAEVIPEPFLWLVLAQIYPSGGVLHLEYTPTWIYLGRWSELIEEIVELA